MCDRVLVCVVFKARDGIIIIIYSYMHRLKFIKYKSGGLTHSIVCQRLRPYICNIYPEGKPTRSAS